MSTTISDPTAGSDLPARGIAIEDLGVVLSGSDVDVVDDIDLVLAPGEIVGLVGESGSGKTTVGTALLGYARAGAQIGRGKVMFGGRDVLALPWQQVRQIRGEEIAYVPQDPASALNPSIRIGKQIVELMELRGLGTPQSRLEGARAGLAEVGLPSDDEFLRRYAHQLSGGQVQRVALAMAFLPRPKVLVLDEPTTGLDVTTQGMVLETMAQLCKTHGVAALYVTHDLAVIANIADRVAVMYAGQIAELGDRETIFSSPTHPYTRALLDAIPHLSHARALSGIPGRTPAPGRRPVGCRFHDRCGYAIPECSDGVPELREMAPVLSDRGTSALNLSESRGSAGGHLVRCIRAGEIGPWDISRGQVPDTDPNKPRDIILTISDLDVFYGRKQVVHGVSFDLGRGEVVALVGESGSGKTTISRCVGGLHKEWTGSLDFEGRPLGHGSRKRSVEDRKRIQYIFQNPYLSLNPRLTIEQIVKRPMELFGIAKGRAATDRVVELLEQVALGPAVLHHQASRLSGGERQRVAIARALAAEPDVLVCDEITSALDVSVQGSIVALLESLRVSRGISMLFVTHNLALVRSIADRIQILNAGQVVESGPVVQVMDSPQDPYTKRLLASSPAIA
jgi:peptide/nickel transport system ATP-binding protein